MFDLLIAEFKDKLVNLVNESGLPPTAIAYVLQDVSQQVNGLVQQQVEAQRKERDKEALEETDETQAE